MTRLRILTTVALAGLCACSLIAKGKGASSSGSSPIAADPDDPPAVKNKLQELEDIEKLLAEARWSDYAVKSKRLHSYFLFDKGLDGQPKRKTIMQRLDALDAKAVATFPRLQALVGEGPRVLEIDA